MRKHSISKRAVIEHEQSSGDIFADVGLSEEYKAKAELASKIDDIIAERQITQQEAARILGIDQPRVSALLRGKLDLFSFGKMIDFVKRLGNTVEITVRRSEHPHISVRAEGASAEGLDAAEKVIIQMSPEHASMLHRVLGQQLLVYRERLGERTPKPGKREDDRAR